MVAEAKADEETARVGRRGQWAGVTECHSAPVVEGAVRGVHRTEKMCMAGVSKTGLTVESNTGLYGVARMDSAHMGLDLGFVRMGCNHHYNVCVGPRRPVTYR